MKKTLLLSLSAILTIFALASCGGGGGGGSSTSSTTTTTAPASSTTTTYTAVAQVGEVVSISITKDANGLPTAYSYQITKSAFGCEVSTASCHTGSGTLSKNADGTFSMSQFPNSSLRILTNGLIFGSIQVPIGGVNTVVPIAGMQQPATTSSDFADAGGSIYNWVQLTCNTPGGANGGTCRTYIGSVKLQQDATWFSCEGYNLADLSGGVNSGNTANCASTASNVKTGKFISNNDGTWTLQASNGSGSYYNIGTFIAFRDPSTGQRVAIFDINDSAHGWGYGQIVAASQVSISSVNQSLGTWVANEYWPTQTSKRLLVKSILTKNASNPTTVADMAVTVTNPTSSQSVNVNGTLALNSVNLGGRGAGSWPGFASPSTDTSEVDLLAGTGFFAGVAGLAGHSAVMIETGFLNE